jgi:hypothetical protein
MVKFGSKLYLAEQGNPPYKIRHIDIVGETVECDVNGNPAVIQFSPRGSRTNHRIITLRQLVEEKLGNAF